MKANFKIEKDTSTNEDVPKKSNETDELTEEEFEEYISKAGAAGSFMVFRSNNKKDELGLESL